MSTARAFFYRLARVFTYSIIGLCVVVILYVSFILYGPPELIYRDEINKSEKLLPLIKGNYEQFKELDDKGLMEFLQRVDLGLDEKEVRKLRETGMVLRRKNYQGTKGLELNLPYGFDNYHNYDLENECWEFDRFRISSLKTC